LKLAGSITGISGTVNSPAQKAAVVAAIENDEDLSDEEFDEAMQLIMSNSNAANMYLAIGKASSHTHFLQAELNKTCMD
jgi:hypothetical protein